GPTPPGFGDIADATSATSLAPSPTIRVLPVCGLARDTNIQNDDTFFDHLLGHHPRVSRSRNDDVCLTDQLFHVAGAGMCGNHGRVDVTTSEQQSCWTTNGDTTAYDEDGFALGFDIVMA